MNWPSIILWGFVATSALSILLRGGQALGITRMDLPFMLGTIFTADRDRAKVYGFLVHLAIGWLFSFLYAFSFEQLGQVFWWLGGLIGSIHVIFVLAVVLPLLPGLHPRMASDFAEPWSNKPLEPPGILALNYGRRTPIVTVLAHIVYGIILGAFYRLG